MTYRFIVALIGAIAIGSAASAAPMKVGVLRQFGMNDLELIGSLNGLLNEKLRTENMVSGGTVKRLTQSKYLYCGFYNSINGPQLPPFTGFAIIHARDAGSFEVYAPLNHKEQLAKGCWPGDDERLKASFDKLLKLAPVNQCKGKAGQPC